MTNIESIRLKIVTCLPVRVQWMIVGTPLDFDFSRAQIPLKPITDKDIVGGDIEEE
jgi:hypothetical protein